MRSKSKVNTRWGEFIGDIYPVRIMFFIGGRKDMAASIEDALGKAESAELESQQKDFVDIIRAEYSMEAPNVDGECIHVIAHNGARLWVVRVDDFNGSVDGMVVLSHECLHAALAVLHYCGVRENPPFEALCYLHGAIYKNFLVCASVHAGIIEHRPTKKIGGK